MTKKNHLTATDHMLAALKLANAELYATLMMLGDGHPRFNNVSIALDATADAIAKAEKV